jgi:hypothetical protein
MLLEKNTIQKLIKTQTVQRYELDYIKHLDNRYCDIIYDRTQHDEKFINLPDAINPILKANRNSNVDVRIGSVNLPLSEYIIPQNSLTNTQDIVTNLLNAVQCHNFNHFVLVLHQTNQNIILELIPETGAA